MSRVTIDPRRNPLIEILIIRYMCDAHAICHTPRPLSIDESWVASFDNDDDESIESWRKPKGD